MSNAHVIAEAGVNHNGKIENAFRLIDIAKNAGADSVKLQIINPYGLYLPGQYKYGHYDINKVIENRFSTVFSDDQYKEIFDYSASINMPCSASVFDEKGLDLLCSFNPPYIKLASSDLTNIRFLRQVSEKNIPVILSTGMASLDEIALSIKYITMDGFDEITLLHCVSIYPCQLEETNLNFITTLQKEFGFPVGFSDHTRTSEAACVAYALGCRWFEKHYTFDNKLDGFDHKHAQNEEEFISYITNIRSVEKSLSNKKTKITDAEDYTSQRARRSLYASRNLKKGEVLRSEDILCVRPSGPMNANQIYELIGKKLLEDIPIHTAFKTSIVNG